MLARRANIHVPQSRWGNKHSPQLPDSIAIPLVLSCSLLPRLVVLVPLHRKRRVKRLFVFAGVVSLVRCLW
jgi:hypothetical protein